jgi:hypothetical protein
VVHWIVQLEQGEILVPLNLFSLHQRGIIGVVEEMGLHPIKEKKNKKILIQIILYVVYFRGRKPYTICKY